MPDALMPAFVMVGFCKEELKPFGPTHEYDTPFIKFAINEMEFPLHKGLLLEADGGGGRGLIITGVDAGELVQPFTVIVASYVPPLATPTLFITGF